MVSHPSNFALSSFIRSFSAACKAPLFYQVLLRRTGTTRNRSQSKGLSKSLGHKESRTHISAFMAPFGLAQVRLLKPCPFKTITHPVPAEALAYLTTVAPGKLGVMQLPFCAGIGDAEAFALGVALRIASGEGDHHS